MPILPPLPDPLRNSPIAGPGGLATEVIRGRVVRIDKVSWTVDVQSQQDSRVFQDVPVASPYLDYKGAGFFGHAIQKAMVLLVVPADSTPPTVLGFVPGVRATEAAATETDVKAETPKEKAVLEEAVRTGVVKPKPSASSASFASGRPSLDEADWMWRGAEGNFVAVYNSGLLALGCSSLCQTLYLPLSDRMVQVFREMEQMSPMGGVRWGVRQLDRNPTEKTETVRLYADDQYTDIRFRLGHVETLGESLKVGEAEAAAALAIKESDAALELVINPQGFEVGSGDARPGALDKTTFRLMLTDTGGGIVGFQASALIYAGKTMHLKARETLKMEAKNWSLVAKEEGKIDGGQTLQIGAKQVVFNGGSRNVAAQGDQVAFAVTAVPFTGSIGGQTIVGVLNFTTPPAGVILPGNSGVKVP